MSSLNEARFSAIAKLQAVLAKHNPGSRRYRQIEYALDLAFSETRTVDDYFVRNLLRDAQRILDRQDATRTCIDVHDFGGDTTQLVRAIIGEVSRSSRHASRVLEGIFAGETASETSAGAGISAARVNQLRRQLKECAAACLGSRNGH